MAETNNAKWGCPYCDKSLYRNGTHEELQQAIQEQMLTHQTNEGWDKKLEDAENYGIGIGYKKGYIEGCRLQKQKIIEVVEQLFGITLEKQGEGINVYPINHALAGRNVNEYLLKPDIISAIKDINV